MTPPSHRPIRLRTLRIGWGRLIISILVLGLGLTGTRALSQIDADLRIIYQEYTLAAAELAHVSADILRFRATIIRAIEAPTKKEFERLTAGLPEQRSRIQHAIDRYAAASLRVSRSGRSEPDDLRAVSLSLDAYFASASQTSTMLIRMWNARSPEDARKLRTKAELHAADNAGPKIIQITLALDKLLETVGEVAKDMQNEGTKTIHDNSLVLMIGSLLIALLNLAIPPGSTNLEDVKKVPA